MATTTQQTTDVATAIAELLRAAGLRVYEFVADNARPPCVVLGQPNLDFNDQSGGFCTAVWYFPVNVITARNDAVSAQRELSTMLLDIVSALAADVPDVFSIEPLDARPNQVAVSGQELPAYLLNIRIRA